MVTTYTYHRSDPGDPLTYAAPEIVSCGWCGAAVAEPAIDDHTYWHEGG